MLDRQREVALPDANPHLWPLSQRARGRTPAPLSWWERGWGFVVGTWIVPDVAEQSAVGSGEQPIPRMASAPTLYRSNPYLYVTTCWQASVPLDPY